MKKIFHSLTIVALSFALCACMSYQAIDAEHNSRNSLDWVGVYSGLIPAASGSGIDVTITLNSDLTYEVRYWDIGRSDGELNVSGTFRWDRDGRTITLDATDIPPHYQVGENRLIQLDLKEKPITGMLAENYVLKKQ